VTVATWTWKMPTRHGQAVQQMHRPGGGGIGLAVLLPGQAYPCERPLLHYARMVALEASYDVLALEYGYQRAAAPADDIGELADGAEEAIRWAAEQAATVRAPLLIGKSLGTAVAAELVDRRGLFPGARSLLLTPLEHAMPLIAAGRAKAVIGTLDPLFARPAMRESRERYPEAWWVVPGTDHGLEAAGDVEASLEALRAAVRAMRAFLTGA
jgi:hypothetical protein